MFRRPGLDGQLVGVVTGAAIGEGEFSDVFEVEPFGGRTPTSSSPVLALKVLKEVPAYKWISALVEVDVHRLLSAATGVVPQFYAHYVDPTTFLPAILMERLVGCPLSSCPFDWTAIRVFEIAGALVRALREVHDFGFILRDLKPSNIFLQDDGRIKLLDFGLAAFADAHYDVELDGLVLGSPGFTPAEVFSGERILERLKSPQRDLFAVGVTLYRLLMAKSPFHVGWGGVACIRNRIRCGNFTPIPSGFDVPESFIEVIHRLLAVDLNIRFATCQDVLIALDAISVDEFGQGF